jgi:hypothetical protein
LTISLPIPTSETRVPLPIFPLIPQLGTSILARGVSESS